MALIDEIKDYLDITWTLDEQEERKLIGIIARGKAELDKKTGAILDYEVEDRAKDLLLEYCRFARDGMLNEFSKAYAPMIKDLIEEKGGTYAME